ncbi:MAG: molybdopterin-binding oxidoreductase, partial [Halalkalicoccus sp.]|nr:molybdopterin-binding oxidoreductase [Halalkalicoccus sp.]
PGWYANNSVKWVRELIVAETPLYGEEWRQYGKWQNERYRLLGSEDVPEAADSIHHCDTQDAMEEATKQPPFIYDQLVKSAIGRPRDNEVIHTVEPTEIVGAAWAGDDDIDVVDVSTDGGNSWHSATLDETTDDGYGWTLFRYQWDPKPGTHVVCSRAKDDRGRSQPRSIASPIDEDDESDDNTVPWNQGGYCSNAYLPCSVTVSVEP